MKSAKTIFFTAFCFLFLIINSQNAIGQGKEASVDNKYKSDLSFMVKSLETMLNLLGDSTVSTQDKDQIISQSYLKYFDSDKVQIEDDLDPNRVLPYNKSVQSYLQDVVFFYHSIQFKFEITDVKKGLNDKNAVYYKVSLEEHLDGINLYGEPIKNIHPRYIEFNLNESAQEFKIVSIYTTKLSEKEDIATWWNQMDLPWRKYFAPHLFYTDSVSIDSILNVAPTIAINDTLINDMGDTIYFNSGKLYNSIKEIYAWTELTIVASDSIKNLLPLNKMTNLEMVNFNGCAIDDVSPLRSILSLKELNANNSLLTSLNDLQYLSSLEKLSIDHTAINDLSVSSSWTSLEDLSMANSQISEFSFLTSISSLKGLNIESVKIDSFAFLSEMNNLLRLKLSSTNFNDLSIINSLTQLNTLYLDETSLGSLEGFSDSLSLEIISIEKTKIADVKPLVNFPTLKMIYCDGSQVNQENVEDFIAINPNVLIIYETKSLRNWWANLDENLKSFIRTKIDSVSEPPPTETLHQIIFTETADLSGQHSINSIEGFQQLINLKKLNINGTMVSDLTPISSNSQLEELILSKTPITDVSPLKGNKKLQVLDIQETGVSDLSSLTELNELELIKADSSGITQKEAHDFNSKNKALLLYQSPYLLTWWSSLPEDWAHLFSKKMDFNKNPSAKELQLLVNSDSLIISNFTNDSLSPIKEFKLLHYLKLDHMNTKNLAPLLSLHELKNLSINNGDVIDLASVGKMNSLTELDLSTTSITDLTFISSLTKITRLNLSGTAVVSIKPLTALTNLQYLDLSNSRVKKINYLNNISSLKELKLTNTVISSKKIDSFKKQRPDVKVTIY